MIKTIIKRDGTKEPFQANKLNRWSEWAADGLDWSSIVLDTVPTLPEECTSVMLQEQLIEKCLEQRTWSYQLMAGRLYVALKRKEIYPEGIPTLKEQHEKMAQMGYMEKLNFTDEQYAELEKEIDHDLDFTYAHYQIQTAIEKYGLADKVKGLYYETPQFINMRMAMALAGTRGEEVKMHDAKRWYYFFSRDIINSPTPNRVSLGTPHRGFSSCCVYTTKDSARSIAVGNHIANTMTYMSAGIGAHMSVRSVNDPIRGGLVKHQGKLPYYRAVLGEVKANLQNSRGGACTMHFNVFDPEVEVLLKLKNPKTTEARQIRGLDYSFGYNRLIAKKVAKNEDIFLFNTYTAPDLYDAFYSGDDERFEQLYEMYEQDISFKKEYVNARRLIVSALNEWNETGRMYQHNSHELNTHTPFKEPIFSSNLCKEVTLVTKPYDHITDLYLEEETSGEVATCNLGGICVDKVGDQAEYEEAAYYTLLMIDICIHLADYGLPHVGFTSKARLNAGVGILGLAHYLAQKGTNYTSEEGLREIERISETHYYSLLKASLRLGKELGNAPWMHKTKWPEGWMPLDTYNKNVDKIIEPEYQYDWEALRQEIVANGGIRNSVLVAHMPTESSSISAGTTNGLYPIRQLHIVKKDGNKVSYWTAPNNDKLADKYQSAWDITIPELTKVYAIIQKYTDQAISADFYRTLLGSATISSTELIQDFLTMVRYGLKTTYYMNQRTSVGIQEVEEAEENCDSCTL